MFAEILTRYWCNTDEKEKKNILEATAAKLKNTSIAKRLNVK